MATSQNQGFIEQLREMRNTRMQQLRQSGQQATLLNRQITAMTTLNKTMEAVLRAQTSSTTALKDINNKQSNIYRQNEQMSKSINNLASSITRSMGSMASAVGRGASGAASAVGSAGGTVVGAASSVASGVASTLAKMLPFAIAGVVGKMAVWDNMDDSVKKDLSDSFGNLVESVFGSIDTSGLKKVTAPITKEFGIVLGALGDTMDGVSSKLAKVAKKMEDIDFERVAKKLEEVSKTTINVITNVSDRLLGIINNPELKYYLDKGQAAYNVMKDVNVPVPEVTSATISAAVGGGGVAYGAYKSNQLAKSAKQAQPVAQTAASAAVASKMPTATSPRKLTDKEIKIMQKSLESMKKFKLGNSVISLLVGRLAALSELGMISGGMKFLKVLKEYKAGSAATAALSGIAAAISYFNMQLIYEQIDIMVSTGVISAGDGEWLRGYLTTEEVSSLAGSIIFGTAGFIGGGLAAGPIGAVGVGAAGSISGGAVGADVGRFGYETVNPMPETLKTTDFERKTENILKQQYYNQQQNAEGNKLKDLEAKVSRGRRSDVKPQGAMTPPSASTTSAMGVVGASEGGAAGYDAIYGFSGIGGDPSIPKTHGGKNLSQLTIGQVLAIAKSRGKNRGAVGKYQFMPSTLEYLLQHAGLTMNDLFSPENQDLLYRVFTELNGQELRKRGIEPTPENLHLAHALGAAGAAQLLKADPNAIAADVLGFKVGSDARITNPQLEQTTGKYIASISGKYKGGVMADTTTSIASSASTPSFADADPSTATTSTSYAENYARRKKEAKEAEKYEEGSESFVGPMMAKSETTKPSMLSAFASQFGINSFTSDFAQKTKELTDVVNSMFQTQTQQQAPVVVSDNSNVTNVINNSAGGGGGPTVNQVVSTHMANMNWQFNSLSGGVRA